MSLANFMVGAQWCCRGDGCHTRLDVGGGGRGTGHQARLRVHCKYM